MKYSTLTFIAFSLIASPSLSLALPVQPTLADAVVSANSPLVPANVCGNGIIEEGEVCDGGPNCAGDCKGGVYTSEVPSGGWKIQSNHLQAQAQEGPEVNQIPGSQQDSPHQLEALDTPDLQVPNPVVCGNGVVEGNESCDDGNTLAGDDCSETCKPEALLPQHTLADRPSEEGSRREGTGEQREESGFVAEADSAHSGCSIQGVSKQGGDYSWLGYGATLLVLTTISLRRNRAKSK